MKTYTFHYIADTNLVIPIKAKNVQSAKKKLEKIKDRPNFIRDYNNGFMIMESEDFITDENGNVIEEETE